MSFMYRDRDRFVAYRERRSAPEPQSAVNAVEERPLSMAAWRHGRGWRHGWSLPAWRRRGYDAWSLPARRRGRGHRRRWGFVRRWPHGRTGEAVFGRGVWANIASFGALTDVTMAVHQLDFTRQYDAAIVKPSILLPPYMLTRGTMRASTSSEETRQYKHSHGTSVASCRGAGQMRHQAKAEPRLAFTTSQNASARAATLRCGGRKLFPSPHPAAPTR